MINVLHQHSTPCCDAPESVILYFLLWLDTMRRDNYLVIMHIIPIIPKWYCFVPCRGANWEVMIWTAICFILMLTNKEILILISNINPAFFRLNPFFLVHNHYLSTTHPFLHLCRSGAHHCSRTTTICRYTPHPLLWNTHPLQGNEYPLQPNEWVIAVGWPPFAVRMTIIAAKVPVFAEVT